MYLSIYYTCLWSVYFGRVSPWGFLWRAGSYFLSVWGSAVWNVGPVQFICALAWGGWRGCTGFFFFLGSVVVSMVRFILVLAGGGWRGCTGFLLVLFVSLVFSKLLILF